MLRLKAKEVQHKTEETQCVHHWIIESADGPVSIGKCKHCGMVKEFYNNLKEVINIDKKSPDEDHNT
jgi:hypothetical protein